VLLVLIELNVILVKVNYSYMMVNVLQVVQKDTILLIEIMNVKNVTLLV